MLLTRRASIHGEGNGRETSLSSSNLGGSGCRKVGEKMPGQFPGLPSRGKGVSRSNEHRGKGSERGEEKRKKNAS